MYKIDLSDSHFLEPSPPKKLVRLGGEHDGGYVVAEDALVSSQCLLSFGIAFDLKFEYDFAALNEFRTRVYMYDKSTNHLALNIYKRILLSLRFRSPRPLFNYFRFLFMLQKLIWSGSLLERMNISNKEGLDCTTLNHVLQSLHEKKGIFLKIDIEGDEYLVLNDIISSSESLNALVIEFHDVNTYLSNIESFVNALRKNGLLIDHLHVNNYGGLSEDGKPNVIEMSFSRTVDRFPNITSLPLTGLDSPNTPMRQDFSVVFNHKI